MGTWNVGGVIEIGARAGQVGLALLGALACQGNDALGPTRVARDGWIDVPTSVGGDGATQFVSAAPGLSLRSPAQNADVGAGTAALAVEGQYAYVLSDYAGLAIIDESDGENPRLAGRLDVRGLPVDVTVRDGLVLAIVNDPALGAPEQEHGRALLIDASTPAAPVLLAEHTFPRSVTQVSRDDARGALYAISSQISICYECSVFSESHTTITTLDLSDPRALIERGSLELPGEVPQRAYRFDDGRLLVATAGESLQLVELTPAPVLGASAPLAERAAPGPAEIEIAAGVVRVEFLAGIGVEPSSSEFLLAPDGQLSAIDSVRFIGASGEVVEPVYQVQRAFALSADGRTLLGFDLSQRLAPRLAGTLPLGFRAERVVPGNDGQVFAVGFESGGPDRARGHLARVDASALEAPLLSSEVSWDATNNAYITRAPFFDVPSGALFIPSGNDRMQLVDTSVEPPALGPDVPVSIVEPTVANGRFLYATSDVASSYAVVRPAREANLRLAYPASFVRVLGDTLARFDDSSSVQLQPSSVDPRQAGTDMTGLLGLGQEGNWQARALRHEGQTYLTRIAGEDRVPTLYGFDVGDPAAVTLTSSLVLPAIAPDEVPSSMLQTRRALLLPRRNGGAGASASDPSYGQRFDIIDLADPRAPRLAARFELPLALAGSQQRPDPAEASVDASWGFGSTSFDPIVSADVVLLQHVDVDSDGKQHRYLDRLDVSNPDAPVLLPAVNIPGRVLTFDAEAGNLLTLDTVRDEGVVDSPSDCNRGYESDLGGKRCAITWHMLSSLSLEGDTATRHGQLLLDDSRRAMILAASGNDVFYVTEPLDVPRSNGLYGGRLSAAGHTITLEHVRSENGQLERLPSLDITGLLGALPRYWTSLLARDGRVFLLNADQLAIVDYRVEPPIVTEQELPIQGCIGFDVSENVAYCAAGGAGVVGVGIE